MENKKKTLVPIIIGVTLLALLVAGATYAYFGASNSASGTTAVEASTEKIGTVVVTNPTENLYMKLSAYDMQESKAGTSYYATNDSSKSYETELSNYTISSYSITGGEEDTVYNCTYKLNITKPSQIQAGDMSLKLQLNGATIDGSSSLDVDLANVSSSYTVTFMKQGNSSGTLVSGDIVFNNTTNNQSHLIGQTLSTVITNSELDCSVAEPGLYDENNNLLISWENLTSPEYNSITYYNEKYEEVTGGILTVSDDGILTGTYDFDNYCLLEDYFNSGKLVISNEVKSIGNYALAETSLKSVIIPNSVSSIGDYAFARTSLTTINIPNSVSSIGNSAFRDSTKLAIINTSSSISNIGTAAFESTTWLRNRRKEEEIVIINDILVSYGTSKNVVIPETVTTIVTGAFENSDIESIEIPSTVTKIGTEVFVGTYYLSSIKVDENNPIYDSRDNCNAIIETASSKIIESSNNTIIPENILIIGESSFTGRPQLTKLVIPKSIKIIEGGSFITWGSGITLYYRGSESEWNNIEFGDNWNDGDAIPIVYNYIG